MEKVVIAVCVDCRKTKSVKAGEVPSGEMPMCECGGIMIADRAEFGEDFI